MKVEFFKQNLINKRYANSLKDAVDELICGQSNIVNGKFSKIFEEKFANYIGAKYCAFLSNGLDALTLSLISIGVGKGDEIIVPNHTYIATWLSILNLGAKVIAVPVKNEFTY